MIWTGLAIGAIYALAALTYNVGFIASGVFNFAQAQFVMIGTFVAYLVSMVFHQSVVLAILASVVAGVVVCGLLAAVEDLVAIRPLAGKGLSGELITTVGIAVLLEGIVLLAFGSDPKQVSSVQSQAYTVLGGRVLPTELCLIGIAVLLTAVLATLARRTTWGITALAAAEDRRAALLRGVNVKRLSLLAFGLAGAIAGGLGPLVSAETFAVYNLGDGLALKAFVVLAIGGFGSFEGALIGGLAVGLIEAASARWVGDNYQGIAVFIVLVAVLLIKPTGLFGRRVERVV